ncbi:MAG: hypothetical protein K8R58_11190 [Bacteroidales bacterium]|nr:hypothetical protein [Bacteroidales bacterium]
MKDDNKTDDILRGSLEGYTKEPSVNVWKGIVRKLLLYDIRNLNFSNLFTNITIFIFISIIVTGVIVYSLSELNNPSVITDEFLSETAINKQIHTEYDVASKNKEIINSNINKVENINTTTPKIQAESTSVTNNNPKQHENKIINKTNYIEQTNEKTYDLNERLFSENINRLNPIYLKYDFLLLNLSSEKSIKYNSINKRTSQNHLNMRLRDDYGKKAKLSFGIFFTPEIINYQVDSKPNKSAYTFDISTIYHYSDIFFLQSGVGISFSEDNGDYTINYEQYDSIGFYYEVNSFTIDPETGMPIFNTSIENIYDSVKYADNSQTNNLYTYLQIPLNLGYNIFDYKRISCNVKGGPVLSILIHEKEPEVKYTNKNALWISIDNNSSKRIKTNWQLSASIAISYRIGKKLSINIEPKYNYYIKSIYEKSKTSTKSPYSLGLRTGLLFNL